MAKRAKSKRKTRSAKRKPIRSLLGWVWRWSRRLVLGGVALIVLWVLAYRWIDPPTTPYILSEQLRLDRVERSWVGLEDVAPVMARSIVAAEDANFCQHWGLDLNAIRDALEDGSGRGASTISQQVVKNAFLWQGRSWFRKVAEAALTPLMETLWPKARILEVYLNIAEMGEGVFGVEAAARHHFGARGAADLTAVQAARLAAILPSPKTRDPARPTAFLRSRSASILDGAATIKADGRADCFTR